MSHTILSFLPNVIVYVLNDEYEKEKKLEAQDENQFTLEDVDKKIEELKGLILQNGSSENS